MDARDERIWLDFVHAEEAYITAMANLRHVDEVAVLREGLRNLAWRRPALVVLRLTGVEVVEQLLPELLVIANVGHSLIGEVRRVILRVQPGSLRPYVARHVAGLIGDQSSDYEAYRRIAELLVEMEEWGLLKTLTNAAALSADPDIREVDEDFGYMCGD